MTQATKQARVSPISERIFKLGWDVEKALTLKPYLGRNGHDK